jgi:hypothetical protein
MLFGKFRGVRVEDVPDTAYLRWLAGLRLKNRGLDEAIQQELRRRECNEFSFQVPVEDVAVLLLLIEAGRQRLDTDQQRRLDAIAATLRQATLASV